ncbi:UDP-N-acetylmuramoyl-tripeptide--D-alanyl-D-alanine ligase [Brevundimonas alba]|uniref:UDP-N-acetylmuramoyl-tripeptide--D-alanyl-D-alanine ligase n=1 Tax=Brevundimonas alba TaxID=74314 RepID=A0A7X5YI11_9CAUL|nr:Mur ligase family protein [Brevundimonas alba]NJC40034.1 UDP-N-acetylmuramoyl-tripeptide--D-alanyl-D-alanine ligase [Brevundimonas alba]
MPDTAPLWTSAEIEAATGGRLSGEPFEAAGITYNSREIVPGDLFLALKGARDGHDFAASAFAAGAAGAITEHAVEGGPSVIVADTLRALEGLGVASRDRSPHVRRGAVTGSVGKTSVTQAIKAGLDLAGPAHASIKSYNNHIGVPLTLARMPRSAARAVFEIGMNAPGEIAPLSKMVRPHAACVTTVGPVHIEAFADGEAGIAREKTSIFEGLVDGGTSVINGDSPWSDLMAEIACEKGPVFLFGTDPQHYGRLLDFAPFEGGARVRAEIDGRAVDFPLRQSGFHWGLNSLCVLLMLEALDVPLETSMAALADFEPLAGRGQTAVIAAPGGAFTLIDESYNANPLSMAAGFRSLGAKPVGAGARRVVVLTDMLELGGRSRDLHEGLAAPIAAAGLDLVHTAGPEMKRLHDILPPERRGLWRETAAELAAETAELVAPGDIVMVKGSNGSKASLVARALAALGASSGSDAPRAER